MFDGKMRHLAVIAAFGALILVGCGGTPPVTATATLPADTDSNLPVQPVVPEGVDIEEGLVMGQMFTDADQCVRIRVEGEDRAVTPIWPVGYVTTVDPGNSNTVVLNEQHQPIGATGMSFSLGGDEMTAE